MESQKDLLLETEKERDKNVKAGDGDGAETGRESRRLRRADKRMTAGVQTGDRDMKC